jgi:CelD/BcsL family acetyltransferase involved in cellulose biosynthesis
MYVRLVENLEQLEPLHTRWDELAGGCIFRSWTWLGTWWKHYGTDCPEKKLRVLLVLEGEANQYCQTTDNGAACAPEAKRIAAILPCYLEKSLTRGRVLRLLGDGEVCSEHLDLLVSATNAPRSADALADYLCDNAAEWDLIDLPTLDLDPDNSKIGHLLAALTGRECELSQTPDSNRWSIELPETWEDFLAQQSKSHRKQLRRLESRVLDSPRVKWHQVKLLDDFSAAWTHLKELHQRRRQSLGEPGCFASLRWTAFHEDVAGQLLREGRLRMSWLELDGTPAAAEYHFAGGRTTYVYQGGLDPDRLDEEPGRLSMIRCLQHAITEGHRKFDLLRGDEPYKAHWRATPKPTFRVQVVPCHAGAKWRFQAWTSVRGAARWVRQVTHLFS